MTYQPTIKGRLFYWESTGVTKVSADVVRKKVRIRKAPQTMREKTATVAAPKTTSRKSRVSNKAKSVLKVSVRPVRRVYSKRPALPQNKLTTTLGIIFRPVKKVLKWLAPTYFVNSWREVRQVTWPTRRETWRLTLAVFIFSIIFGLAAYGVDSLLDFIFKRTVLK